MQQKPIRSASALEDNQADLQQQPQLGPQDLPGPALPGLWRRAAPQLHTTLQEQMVDLGEAAQSRRSEQFSFAGGPLEVLQSQRSLRELYALPGQVQRTGESLLVLLHLHFSGPAWASCHT